MAGKSRGISTDHRHALGVVLGTLRLRPATDLGSRYDCGLRGRGNVGGHIDLRRLAGRSARTDGIKTSRSPLEFVALVAPAVFIIGLVVSVAMLATLLQGVVIPGYPHDPTSYAAGRDFLRDLAHAAHADLGRLAGVGLDHDDCLRLYQY